MKQIIFATLVLLSMTYHASAQRLFFHANLGYCIPVGGQTFGVAQGTGVGSRYAVNGSLGSGPAYNFGMGYMLGKTIGVDLTAGILLPFMQGNIETRTPYGEYAITNINSQARVIYNTTSFYLVPALIVRASSGRRIVPYGKFGMFMGLYNQIKIETEESTTEYKYQNVDGRWHEMRSKSEELYTGKLALGISSALGLDLLLSKNKNFGMFIELTSRTAHWTPGQLESKLETTDRVTESYQVLSDTRTSTETTVTLVKDTPDGYSGTNQIGQIFSLNSFGLHFGIKWFILTKKGKEAIGGPGL